MTEKPSVRFLCETEESPKYPTRPDDFDLKKWGILASCFGKSEIETTAYRLIAFFQATNRWHRFTLDQLRRYYELRDWNPNTMLCGLMGAWYDDGYFEWQQPSGLYIGMDLEGNCFVTDQFIERCSRNIDKKAA